MVRHASRGDNVMSGNPIQILASFKSPAKFVYLTNFGLPNDEVQEMFDWVGH